MKDQDSNKADLRRVIEGSVTPRTLHTYEKALRGIDFEVTDTTLAGYVRQKFAEGLSPSTVQGIVKAVQFDAKRNGKPDPVGPFTAGEMIRINREGRDRGRGQAVGLQWEAAKKMAEVAASDGITLLGIRDAAIVMLMSDGLLRVAEVRNLQVDDLSFEEDGSARLLIRYSKTDQQGKNCPILYLGEDTADYLRGWLRAARITKGPIFRRIWVGRNRKASTVAKHPMSTQALARVVKIRAEAIGIEGGSGHSFRVGSAQSLAEAGASLVEMQIAGRWKSPNMPAKYAGKQQAAKGAVARLRYGQGGG